jgi:hypothetical protein
MTSYQTVQLVVFSATPVVNQDYLPLAPGYTVSGGSVAVAGGSSGTSLKWTSNLSGQVSTSLVTLDLSATGVTAASSYNSLTVDAFGRVTAAAVVAGGSGNSLFWTSNISAVVTGSNVTLDLPRIVVAGSGCSVSYDSTGRVTAAATSITTASVTGVWTSAVSATDVQGLGSTWTVSRLSSDRSILGNEVWSSGFSALGSIATLSRVSSNVTIIGNAVWASGFSGLGSIATVSRVSSDATVVANEVWASGVSVGSIVSTSRVSSSVTVIAAAVWASGFSGLGSIATISRISSNLTVYGVDLWGSALSLTGDARIKGVSYTWPTASASGVLNNDGAGVLTWAAGGSGAPTDAQYVTLALNGTLSAERVLTVDSSISMFDGGANGNVTLSARSALGGTSIRTLSADTGRVNLALAHVDDLGFPLAASTWYRWVGLLYYRAQATTTGLRVKLLSSTAATKWAGAWDISFAADGSAGVYCSSDTNANNSVESATATATLRADETYLARGEYLFLTGGAASNASVAFATEITNSRVTLEAGSACFLTRLS